MEVPFFLFCLIDSPTLVHICGCLTFFLGTNLQVCLLELCKMTFFCSRAAAVSVNQSMGPGGKDRELKDKECKPSLYRTGDETRQEYSLFGSHASSCSLFVSCQRHNKAQQM